MRSNHITNLSTQAEIIAISRYSSLESSRFRVIRQAEEFQTSLKKRFPPVSCVLVSQKKTHFITKNKDISFPMSSLPHFAEHVRKMLKNIEL